RLIPVLVGCTVYSQDQIAEFESLPKVDEHIPDAPEDIRPMFHRAKSGGEEEKCLSRGTIYSNQDH
ncbi:unnamed protein product, partial [Laminaria digitata]